MLYRRRSTITMLRRITVTTNEIITIFGMSWYPRFPVKPHPEAISSLLHVKAVAVRVEDFVRFALVLVAEAVESLVEVGVQFLELVFVRRVLHRLRLILSLCPVSMSTISQNHDRLPRAPRLPGDVDDKRSCYCYITYQVRVIPRRRRDEGHVERTGDDPA